jgi:hypothetical protein
MPRATRREHIRAGRRLAEQPGFDAYLDRQRVDPSHTFRQCLRAIGGAIEE